MAAQTFNPETNATVHVWTNASLPGFTYPELSPDGAWGVPHIQARPNIGVALSGGGFRAATLSLGWVRMLYEVGQV